MMKRLTLLLLALLIAATAHAGPYSDQLRTDPPKTGRTISEDGTAFNTADYLRRQPVSVARGDAPAGYEPFASFGERTSTGAETNFPVWPDGVLTFAPQLGVQMSVQSTSANDAAGGTNIRTVEIHYLDRRLTGQAELVTLNGTTSVLTEATDIRWIQCMHLVTTGATPRAAGNITATYGGGTYSYIPTNGTRCTSAFRMVPRGKYLYIDGAVGASTSTTADTTTTLRLVATEIDNHQFLKNPMRLIPSASIGLQNGSIGFDFPPGIRFGPGTLVGCTHTTNKAATVSCSWFGRLEPIDSSPVVEHE